MKKIILTVTAIGAAALSVPAIAGTITAEVRLSDVRSGATDSTEYRVEYSAPLNSLLNYGAEIAVKQREDAGSLGSDVSARIGPNLPVVLGFNTAAYGEVGRSLNFGDNYTFWGAGAKTSRQVYGPVSVTAGYRHRESFTTTGRMTENRLSGGVAMDVGDGNSLAVNYYRTTGTTRADAVGVALNHRF